MPNRLSIIVPLLLCASVPAAAQLALPTATPALDRIAGQVGGAIASLDGIAAPLVDRVEALARQRVTRLAELVRRHPEAIELDAAGSPARKGELLLTDPTDAALAKARAAGFAVIGSERLDELGLVVTRLAVPAGMPLARAEKELRRQVPDAEISADTLHFLSGATAAGAARHLPPSATAIDLPVGVIDGAPGPAQQAAAVQGFARGAPLFNDHGSAVVSLLRLAGAGRVLVADVYGNDPAGGNALAIARGLNWLVTQRVRVISISLVGPANPVIARAVAAVGQRGGIVVAAVGNDGPAAPPAYPASYPGVLAVTGVDGRNRALIEAGRALHLDYAAPGADMAAANAAGQWVRVRGTSYAVPLVAARVASAMMRAAPVIPTLDGEAIDLGSKGADRIYGRGLLCGTCRRRP